MNNTHPHWQVFIEYEDSETATDDIVGDTISEALANACYTYPGSVSITIEPHHTRHEDERGIAA